MLYDAYRPLRAVRDGPTYDRAMGCGLALTLMLSATPTGTPAEETAVKELHDRIHHAVMGVGEAVGCDIGDGEAVIHVAGDDVARLVEIVLPLARAFPWRAGSCLLTGEGRIEL